MGVIKSYQINGANPVTVGGAGTTIKYFSNAPGANVWNSGATGVNTGISSQFNGLTPSSTSNGGGLQIPGNAELNGQRFLLSASGNILFGAGEASTTGKVGLYLSFDLPTATSPTYNTLIELTLTNQAVDGVYYPWYLNAELEGDTQSGILQIVKSGAINGTVTTSTQVTALTGANFSNDPGMTAVVGVTFGASNAGNSANLFQLQVSLP